MSDPRVTPDPALITRSDPKQIAVPFEDLSRTPHGPRDRQLIFGDSVTVLNFDGVWRYVQSTKDNYCGYVKAHSLHPVTNATHIVTAPATHAYTTADFKSPERCSLTFASKITALSASDTYIETAIGFIPAQHLSPLPYEANDPAAIAELFLGTPYLWGGNSRWGIDCSGLIQAALLACAIPCPGDSDQQMALGADATTPYKRNDLLFWKGHVALVTDAETIIHANANTMSVTYERISDAIQRIKEAGDGPLTAHRRL
jgi:cell wall-associated NlpC family hydrolase